MDFLRVRPTYVMKTCGIQSFIVVQTMLTIADVAAVELEQGKTSRQNKTWEMGAGHTEPHAAPATIALIGVDTPIYDSRPRRHGRAPKSLPYLIVKADDDYNRADMHRPPKWAEDAGMHVLVRIYPKDHFGALAPHQTTRYSSTIRNLHADCMNFLQSRLGMNRCDELRRAFERREAAKHAEQQRKREAARFGDEQEYFSEMTHLVGKPESEVLGWFDHGLAD